MKTVWRRIIGPDVLGITTFEPGDKVKLKNPAPTYHIMGEIKDPNSDSFKPSPILIDKGFKEGDELLVNSIIPFDSRLFQSDDFYICTHINSGKVIKLQRVYLDEINL